MQRTKPATAPAAIDSAKAFDNHIFLHTSEGIAYRREVQGVVTKYGSSWSNVERGGPAYVGARDT